VIGGVPQSCGIGGLHGNIRAAFALQPGCREPRQRRDDFDRIDPAGHLCQHRRLISRPGPHIEHDPAARIGRGRQHRDQFGV